MSKKETISREEFDTLPRSELNDDFVLDFVSKVFNVSVWQIFYSAQLTEHKMVYTNHIDDLFEAFWSSHQLPHRIRRHAIDALLGRTPLITTDDEGRYQAILAA